MTNSNDRLNQIEELLRQSIVKSDERMTRMEQRIEQERAESRERLTSIEQLTESNSRAIQALTDDLATFRLTVEQNIENARAEREELRRATIGIANLLASLDSDRPTILRKLNTIENKVDRLLKRENGEQPPH